MRGASKNTQHINWLLGTLLFVLSLVTFTVYAKSDCPDAAHKAYQLGNAVEEKYMNGCKEDCLTEKRYFFSRAVALCDTYAEAHNDLGDVYEKLGRYPEALTYYQRAVESNPNLAVAHLSLGDVYQHLGEYAKAVQAYDRGLRLDPQDRLHKRPMRSLAQHLLDREGTVDATAIETVLGGATIKTMGVSGIRHEKRIAVWIPFDYNSDQLSVKAEEPFRELGTALKNIITKSPSASFLIEGHTDMRGSEAYNQDLSERRARRTVEALIDGYQIPRERLTTRGYGETRPLSLGATEADYARNRRVEVVRMEGRIQEETYMEIGDGLSSVATGKMELYAAVFYEDAEYRPRKLTPGGILHSGDGYRLYIEPKQSGYLYIFQIDVSGKLTTLYPNTQNGIRNNAIQAQAAFWIPGRDRWFVLDRNRGLETIYVVMAKQQRADIEDLLARYGDSEVPVPKEGFENDLILTLKTMGVGGIRSAKQVPVVSNRGDTVQVAIDELVHNGEGLVYTFHFLHK